MWHHARTFQAAGYKGPQSLQRPPGARRENGLADRCTGCGDCAHVCPQKIIALDDDGLPMVTAMGSCGRCGLCADVCSHGAIELTQETRIGLRRVLEAEARDKPAI